MSSKPLTISNFANSTYGVGITGKLNRADINNNYGKDNQVFVSIYYKDNYYDMVINVDKKSRKQNKVRQVYCVFSSVYKYIRHDR